MLRALRPVVRAAAARGARRAQHASQQPPPASAGSLRTRRGIAAGCSASHAGGCGGAAPEGAAPVAGSGATPSSASSALGLRSDGSSAAPVDAAASSVAAGGDPYALDAPAAGAPRCANGRRVALLGMRRAEVAAWLKPEDERPVSRAEQVFATLYRHAEPLGTAKAVSRHFRAKMEVLADTSGDLSLASVATAADGTRKLVFKLADAGGGSVESVIIPARNGERTTLCVSSQLGCALNCQFCLTARMGLRRHLSAAQIVGQVLAAKQLLKKEGGAPLDNIVFMGMGEPLHNLEAVLSAVDILVDPAGFAFSRNRVTVSTSGLVPPLRRFLAESPANLAVSLNATDDRVRSWIMPVNRKYPLADLLRALRDGFPRVGAGRGQDRVFFEYVMLDGVNDTDDDKRRLMDIATSLPCKVNLIEFNAHHGSEFKPSPHERVVAFRDALAAAGITATIRESRGDDAMAACGQLGRPDEKEAWVPSPPRMKPPKEMREAAAAS